MTDPVIKNMPLMISALRGEKTARPPIWLMRQAGRYLPEYRELRAKAGGFLAMAYDPELASEITLQPIRRFGMDGAILFSDILVIPHALGQDLRFETGEGPKLDPVRNAEDLSRLTLSSLDDVLNPIYETLRLTRRKLDAEGFGDTALIGFCGAPWTVACYMVEGHGSKDFATPKQWAYADPEGFSRLIDLLVEASAHYLANQIEAGAQIVQIFESWAGVLDEEGFDRWSIAPTKKLVHKIKAQYPHIPVIGFPRGATLPLMDRYVEQTGVDGIGCDYTHAPADLKSLQQKACVQGNLDPEILLAGGAALEAPVQAILDELASGPFIFNLGHGVIKETDPESVARLVKQVQGYRA